MHREPITIENFIIDTITKLTEPLVSKLISDAHIPTGIVKDTLMHLYRHLLNIPLIKLPAIQEGAEIHLLLVA